MAKNSKISVLVLASIFAGMALTVANDAVAQSFYSGQCGISMVDFNKALLVESQRTIVAAERIWEVNEREEEIKRRREVWANSNHELNGVTMTGREWTDFGNKVKNNSNVKTAMIDYLISQGRSRRQAELDAKDFGLAAIAMGKLPDESFNNLPPSGVTIKRKKVNGFTSTEDGRLGYYFEGNSELGIPSTEVCVSAVLTNVQLSDARRGEIPARAYLGGAFNESVSIFARNNTYPMIVADTIMGQGDNKRFGLPIVMFGNLQKKQGDISTLPASGQPTQIAKLTDPQYTEIGKQRLDARNAPKGF